MVSVAYSHRIVCDTAFLKWLLKQPEKNELFRQLMFIKGSSQDHKKCHNVILETELNQDRTQINLDDNTIGAAFRVMPNPKFLESYKDQISKNINFAIELANDTPFKSYIFTASDKENDYKTNKHFQGITSVEVAHSDKTKRIINDFFSAFKVQRDLQRN
jgi:hypothetical protein